MKLKEIFDALTAGEFSQLSIGGAKLGEIQEEHWVTVASHITLGLTALYRRFNLRRGTITLALQPNKTIYALDKAYAVSNTRSKELVKYILDTGLPFNNDIIKIDTVLQYDPIQQKNVALPLNDALDPESLFTPRGSTLQVPASLSGNIIISYRANHPPLTSIGGVIVPESTEVELDPAYLQALLYFVAARAHNPLGMGNTEFNAGNNWAAKYEKECAQIMLDNPVTDAGSDSRTQSLFDQRGFC